MTGGVTDRLNWMGGRVGFLGESQIIARQNGFVILGSVFNAAFALLRKCDFSRILRLSRIPLIASLLLA